MVGTHDLWAFVAASVLLWLTPGPDRCISSREASRKAAEQG